MAIPAVITVATTAGLVAAEVNPTTASNSSTSIIIGGVVAVIVALVGGTVQVIVSRRNKDDAATPELTVAARVAVLETNQADMKRDIEDILDHVRPWSDTDKDRRRSR